MAVAMGFEYFCQQKVDVAIIEVGMGGRLDSTNIITPSLSIITNISFDHQQFLGETLSAIAEEKAGIIKNNIPVVIGETHAETKSVFDAKALEMNAPIVYADAHFAAIPIENSLTHSVFDVYKDGEMLYPKLKANLNGDFQIKNIQTVLQAVEVLQPSFPLQNTKIRQGLQDLKQLTRFIGRWQILGEKPLIIADSAHNEGGIRLVVDNLKTIPHQTLHFVMGVVNDKAFDALFELLPQDAIYYFAKADIPRGLEAAILQKQAAAFGLNGKNYTSVEAALNAAKGQATAADLIFIGGSIFVVAEVI